METKITNKRIDKVLGMSLEIIEEMKKEIKEFIKNDKNSPHL